MQVRKIEWIPPPPLPPTPTTFILFFCIAKLDTFTSSVYTIVTYMDTQCCPPAVSLIIMVSAVHQLLAVSLVIGQ